MGSCSFIKTFSKTFFSYPSCMFWASIINPYIALVISYFMYFNKYPLDFHNFPIETFLFQYQSSKIILQTSGIFQIIFIINVFFYVRRFFIKSIRSAAPLAKITFEKYTKLIIIPIFFYLISYLICLFLNSEEYQLLYLFILLVSYFSYFMYIFCFNQMNMVKEGKIYPSGFGADIVILISFIFYFPLLFYLIFFFNSSKDSFICTICAFSQMLFNFSLTIKNIIIAFKTLENKFSKLQDINI